LVLEYRALAKLKSTYVDSLPRLVDADSRIHTRLNQTVTATGRLSSKDPNLQNIPIRTDDGVQIRKAFVAGAGRVLVSADYNQIELRVLAHLAEDGGLIRAFEEGVDIHVATAADVFEVEAGDVTSAMRRAAKVINYGIIYGMGPVRMSRELAIPRTRAAQYIDRYFERYAGVRKLYERTLEKAREQGYVSTLLGRRRYLPDLGSDHGGLRQAAERVATNTPIQGSAADIIKTAMVRLDRSLAAGGVAARLVLQIHDELLVECPEHELDRVVTLIRDAMEGAAELVVPLAVDVGSGPNWAAAH
jgi:DNA polymerase-1